VQSLRRFLLSRKTVISLICVLSISCVIGSTIPQLATRTPQFFEQWKTESPRLYGVIDLLQFNRIYTSVWFLIIVALTACSLAYSIYYQSKKLIRSRKPTPRNITPSLFKNYYGFTLTRGSEFSLEGLAHDIEGVLRARGYRPHLVTEGSKYFVFGKHRWGRWGALIFHVALLVIIVAALLALGFQKKGMIQLIPTETFQGRDEDWQVKNLGVFARDFDLGYQVRLDDFAPTYWENDDVKDLQGSLTVIDEKAGQKAFSLSPGHPIHLKGTRIYQTPYYGYALGFILKKEGDKDLIMTRFFLDAPGEKDKPFAGRMDFRTTDYTFDMAFYPNLIEPSRYATLPGVDLTITEKDKTRFNGRVLFGQRVWLNNDTMTFATIHYWTGLIFKRDYGMSLVYVGFVLGTLGAVLMFMFPYKEVHVKVAEQGDHIHLSMGGRTRRYKALFSEELKEIAQRVGKGFEGHGSHTVA
jgi:cytochrome c biogenesis protein ResB